MENGNGDGGFRSRSNPATASTDQGTMLVAHDEIDEQFPEARS
jgi:hypothetical protein